MSKRWTKKKAGKQRSKQRKAVSHAADGGAGGASGAMGGLRGLMKAIAGTGSKKPRSGAEKAFDLVLWLAVAAALFYFFSKQCA